MSGKCSDWLYMATTVVDSISTMALMELKEPLQDAMVYISSSDFEKKLQVNQTVSTFEATIRILGGLLSSYDLTGEDIFLQRATLLGDGLVNAFHKSGLPLAYVNLATGEAETLDWLHGNVLLAEIMTIQLEFFKLTEYTNNSKYRVAAQKSVDILEKIEKPLPGQFPIYITLDGAKA